MDFVWQSFAAGTGRCGETTVWTFAIVMALVGGINPHFDRIRSAPRVYLIGWLRRMAPIGLVSLVFAYLFMPAMTGPFWGLTFPILIAWTINFTLSALPKSHPGPKGVFLRRFRFGGTLLAVFVGIVLVRVVCSWSVFRAADYRATAGDVETRTWNQDMSPVDAGQIRMVSREQAVWLGNQVLGDAPNALGSRSRLGDYSLQRVRDELFWVAPLEFEGFMTWWSHGHTEGFVMVSAQDLGRKPQLVLGKQFRFMPSAWGTSDLQRHVYLNGYSNFQLYDTHFELDDDLRPFWVVTLTRPTIQYGASAVAGVLLVDPESGAIIFHDPDKIPEWVDRVVPESIAQAGATWWGRYGRG